VARIKRITSRFAYCSLCNYLIYEGESKMETVIHVAHAFARDLNNEQIVKRSIPKPQFLQKRGTFSN
jgi:hypothetical protein